jgi:hypothetical protein
MDYDGSVAKPMLTLYQAADRLGVGPWVVRQLIRRGLLVVWADDRDRNGFFQIRMRGFESDGRQRLSERTVNTDPDRPCLSGPSDSTRTVRLSSVAPSACLEPATLEGLRF